MKLAMAALVTLLALTASGCATIAYSAKAENGITYYCPGAGNTDFGDAGLRSGLESAGYKGEVAGYIWTISFNVALDQTLRFNAKLKGQNLARLIEEYIDKYPGKPVNLVGLSAGTGVAVWALEDLKEGYNVDSVVLLSSSLWNRYDVGKAARHVKTKIYVYYSSNDAILAGPMKLFGSIDGVFGEDGAGAVGLHTRGGAEKVVNIGWKSEWSSYGYYGGHTDSTSSGFVRAVLSRHLLNAPADVAKRPGAAPATSPATTPPAAASQ
jgi:pimeloyl-ACP methyl ester carboxylesterase